MISLKSFLSETVPKVYCSTNISKQFHNLGRRKKKNFEFLFTTGTRRNITDEKSADFNIADYRMIFSAN